MPQKITDTAQLQCDKGTTIVKLKVTNQNFSFFDEKLIATELDAKPIVNIKPFGVCKLKPTPGGYSPCIPATQKWSKTSNLDEINGLKIVLDSSQCLCSTGGKIAVLQKGHQGEIEMK